MKPNETTSVKPLEFKQGGEASQKMTALAGKIGWLHAQSNKPGAQFDIVIKDSLGRDKFRGSLGSKFSTTDKMGALINLPTHMGEELEVVVENLRNADSVQVFLN